MMTDIFLRIWKLGNIQQALLWFTSTIIVLTVAHHQPVTQLILTLDWLHFGLATLNLITVLYFDWRKIKRQLEQE